MLLAAEIRLVPDDRVDMCLGLSYSDFPVECALQDNQMQP
jgi:hypothetical protein